MNQKKYAIDIVAGQMKMMTDSLKQGECTVCYNTGYFHVANGPTDYDSELCDCIYGEKLREVNN